MTKKETIESFLGEKQLAVVGVSRSGKKFGNAIYTELKSKGYTVYPVNPNAERIGDDVCYPNIAAIPEAVGGIIAVVPPAATAAVVVQAAEAGVRKIWMQRGAESKEAIAACDERNLEVVHGECIFMFAEPVSSIHKVHRFFKKLFGGMPK